MPERRHMILCTVTDVRDVQVVYPCCSQCCSKLRSDCFQDRWQCLKCGCISTNEELDWRYRLSLMVSDGPYLANICVFGSVLEQFFGLPSNQFVRFLRKIESMYGNSEDVLMLGLKQCFIGNLYYFGVKATTASSKENIRISLADIVKQKRTACQNSLFSQEEYSNVVAFQMVPAIDREMNTVYDIIRNFFKDSSEGIVNREPVHAELCTSNFSSFNQINSGMDSTAKSVSNLGYSSLSSSQTTALLSCELSDIDKFDITTASRRNISLAGSKGSTISENNLKIKDFSMSECKTSNQSLSFMENSLDTNIKKNNQNRVCKGGSGKNLLNSFKHDNIELYREDETRGSILYPSRSKENTHLICGLEKNLNLNSEHLSVQSNNSDCDLKTTQLKSNVKLSFDAPQKENRINCGYISQPETLPVILQKNKEISTVALDCVENCRTDSEPLFSQDNSMLGLDLSKTHPNQQKYHCGKTEITKMKDLSNFGNNLDGTILLQNLKVPDLPENIPDSEGLDLYLLNDSDFDSEYHDDSRPVSINKLENAKNRQDHCTENVDISSDHMTGAKQPVNQSDSKYLNKDSVKDSQAAEAMNEKLHFANANNIDDGGQETQRNTSSCKNEFCDSLVINELQDIDGIFESSFDNSQCRSKEPCSENYTGAQTMADNPDLNDGHGDEGTEPKCVLKSVEEIDQISDRNVNVMDDENVLSCCPELSEVDSEQLYREFETNLCTNVKVEDSHDKSIGKSFDQSGDLLFESQFTEQGSKYYDASEFNKSGKLTSNQCKESADCAHLIADSQEPCLQKDMIDSNNYKYCNVESQNLVSDSIYNASEDLFGEQSLVHSLSGNDDKSRFELVDMSKVKPCAKSTKKCVKFSRRLSHQKSVHLIDLQMKINQNPTKLNAEVKNLKKSCLKQALDNVIDDSFKHRDIDARVLTAVENSPILDNNFTPLSQDLFSPSPVICFKRQKSVNLHLKEHLEHIFEQTEEYEKSNIENSSRYSSTPIETEADVEGHEDYTGESILSVFAESFEEEFENESHSKHHGPKSLCSDAKDINSSSRSLSLFSQSCSLFSRSNSKIFSRGDNHSVGSQKGSNSLIYQSCDLFSPSGCESINSPQGDINMPVKRLFSDKI